MADDESNYMTADEMAEAKHKADMDDKMKAMVREILFYAVLLFLLLIVINGQQDTNSYRQNANIIKTFQAKLNKDVSRLACYSHFVSYAEATRTQCAKIYASVKGENRLEIN